MRYWIDSDQLKELANAENGNQIFVLCHKIARTQKLETERVESMNKGLAQTLVDFYKHYSGQPLHLQSVPLTKNQYNNFQKLQYHKLVVNTRPGYWDLTARGEAFLKGAQIPKSVTLDSGIIVGESKQQTSLFKLLATFPKRIFPQREDYLR